MTACRLCNDTCIILLAGKWIIIIRHVVVMEVFLRRIVVLLMLVTTVLPAYSQSTDYPALRPLFSFESDSFEAPVPAKVGFFSRVEGPIALPEQGRAALEDAVFWNWMTVGGFSATTLAFIVTQGVHRTVGGVLSLASVGFWTVSNFATAFTHRTISVEIKNRSLDVERPLTAGIASLTGGVLGVGALTAVALIFSDTTDVAEITAYICFGLSAVSGGYGVFKTFEYASAAGTDLSFF